MKNNNCTAVYCCGCTDCFPQAMFIDELEALKWANENCTCPEGFILKKKYSEVFDD